MEKHVRQYVDDFMAGIIAKNPGEKEFHQAVHEVIESLAPYILENPVLVNNVRGVQGYTGTYKGVKVSVMASGMGMPSIGIYSHELYNVFGVENILRVGSAGALQEGVRLYDLVLGQGACTDSNWAAQFHLAGTFAPIGSFDLLTRAVEAGMPVSCGQCPVLRRFLWRPRGGS